MPTLLLVDGNAIVHRAFHALPPFTAPDGRPTGAVYGFFSTLFSAIKQFEATHVAVAFDVAGPTFRHKEYKKYKATRVKAPQELYDQLPMIRKLLQVMHVAQFGVKGYEADDILATIVAKMTQSSSTGTLDSIEGRQIEDLKGANDSRLRGNDRKGGNDKVGVIILTGDLDALQLVSDRVSVCALRRGIKDSTIYDKKIVQETFGFEPKYMLEYKMLKGDSSDNIPGVPGIGEKTARAFISQYHTIHNLYRHLDDLPNKIKVALRSHKNKLAQSEHLIQLHGDVPINFSLDKAKFLSLPSDAIKEFEKLGMKSLAKRIQEMGEAKQETLL